MLTITAIYVAVSASTRPGRSPGPRLGYKREPERVSNATLKVVAVGGKAFVTGFVLSGVLGSYASGASEALGQVKRFLNDPEVGLIMISSEIAKPIRADLTSMRAKRRFHSSTKFPAQAANTRRSSTEACSDRFWGCKGEHRHKEEPGEGSRRVLQGGHGRAGGGTRPGAREPGESREGDGGGCGEDHRGWEQAGRIPDEADNRLGRASVEEPSASSD